VAGGSLKPETPMAGLDPAIQGHSGNFIVLSWMAASEGGHDVKGYCCACIRSELRAAAYNGLVAV
jgi:hypothetical protein